MIPRKFCKPPPFMIYLNIFGSGKVGSLQMDFLGQALVRPPPKLGIRGKQKIHIFHWWVSGQSQLFSSRYQLLKMVFFQTKIRRIWTTPWAYSTKLSPVVLFFKPVLMVCSNFLEKIFFTKKQKISIFSMSRHVPLSTLISRTPLLLET